MKIKLLFRPPDGQIPNPRQYDYFVKLNYQMFDELKGEYDPEFFAEQDRLLLEVDPDNDEIFECILEIERPFGSIDIVLSFAKKGTSPGDDTYQETVISGEPWFSDYFL